MSLIPTPERIAASAANAYDLLVGESVGDLRRTPAQIIDEAPQRTIFRFRPPERHGRPLAPVLLIPPLAAPTLAFDLRRGCSLAEYLVAEGRPTYMADYGEISFSDRDLGLEHWIDDVIPQAVEIASRDAGDVPVHVVGWCLGAIMSLMAAAAHEDLPIASITAVAAPFDTSEVKLVAPLRPLAELTGGAIGTALYRVMGGAPAPLVRAGYRLAAFDKYLLKPVAIAQHLDDRDFLAQIEAVDRFTSNMIAYPGRTMGQLYHRFFIVNELAEGTLELPDRTVDLADVRVPVLAVAGRTDALAPVAAVRRLVDLLPNAPEVRFETAPGGHLGVLTGRGARTTTWAYLDAFMESIEGDHAASAAHAA